MRNMKQERMVWIDCLKMGACVMVMLGHFHAAFYSFCTVPPKLSSFSIGIYNFFPRPFMDGNFWVCVFCILSGVLASRKVVYTWKELLKEMLLRYFRFVIPLMLINFTVYLIDISVGFSNDRFASLYGNIWLGSYFKDISLKAVITNSLFLGDRLNGPLWMLRPLFVGNMFILATNYIVSKFRRDLGRKKRIIILGVLFLMLAATFERADIVYVFVTYMGLLLWDISDKRKNIVCFWTLIIVVIVAYYVPIIDTITTVKSISFKNPFFSLLFVYDFLNWNSYTKSRFAMRLPFGAMSFWIYLTHWPIVCAFSSEIIVRFKNYTMGYWITLSLTIIVVCLLSYLLVQTFEQWMTRVMLGLKRVIEKALCLNVEK